MLGSKGGYIMLIIVAISSFYTTTLYSFALSRGARSTPYPGYYPTAADHHQETTMGN